MKSEREGDRSGITVQGPILKREMDMGYARKSLICLQDTSYYHCVARCVRRAWLCGVDEYAGKDYSHRKAWVLERLAHLTQVFAIDVCAYAVMSNHYHLVLYVDQRRARAWSESEVAERWGLLFRVPEVVQRYQEGVAGAGERMLASALIATWRVRLGEISWFMKCMNEHLARRANQEEGCDGRFWQGRFRSQALLDEAGLLTAMAYVDLNPIRAGIAATPELSAHTSIHERIRQLRDHFPVQAPSPSPNRSAADRVVPLKALIHALPRTEHEIPFALTDYLTLVDWSGRIVRADKAGYIEAPPLLTRLNIDAEAWGAAMRPQGILFGRALGRLDHLRLHAKTLGQAWIRGLRHAERLYGI